MNNKEKLNPVLSDSDWIQAFSDFAKTNQMDLSQEEIDNVIEFIEGRKEFVIFNQINFNKRKRNGIGTGGSVVFPIRRSFILNHKKFFLNSYLYIPGKHHGVYEENPQLNERIKAGNYSSAKKLEEAMRKNGTITPDIDIIHDFSYTNGTIEESINDFNRSYTEELVARKSMKKLEESYLGEIGFLRDKNMRIAFFRINGEGLWTGGNPDTYKFGYKVKFLTKPIKLPENYRNLFNVMSETEKNQTQIREIYDKIKKGESLSKI